MFKLAYHVLKNMGIKYVLFRILFEFRRRVGLLRRKFPVLPIQEEFISLSQWRLLETNFFFDSKDSLEIRKSPNDVLKSNYENICKGKYSFFNSIEYEIYNLDWLTNIKSGYKYDITKHWTEIEDVDSVAGDIKYVWELSRFSFLYNVIRYDYHFEKDCSDWVFSIIEDWIDSNPINMGPNYKCSQEIAIRVLNWTFALNYYKNSLSLSDELFQKILHHIRWQIQHVFDNINFSLIAVRNNHAISETSAIYLTGLLFPFFPNSKKWKDKGKLLFEREVKYQVYSDGTYLMHSTNYHRTVLQFFTWVFYLSKLNNESLHDETYQRVYRSIDFLYNCHDEKTGFLPNYGHNDGSLFCKLNDSDFRNYANQLNALYFFYKQSYLFEGEGNGEEALWYNSRHDLLKPQGYDDISLRGMSTYSLGGYYLIREDITVVFIKCGEYTNRPSQSDNLHVDIWYDGNNILRDAGTYSYNTSKELTDYFSGTSAHNSVKLGEEDQMKKGPRFIWLNWSKLLKASLTEYDNYFKFDGSINTFTHIDKKAVHNRSVVHYKSVQHWEITDTVSHNSDLPINQYWNKSELFDSYFEISAIDGNGITLEPKIAKGWYSGYYGVKESTEVLVFSTDTNMIQTTIFKK